MFLFYFKSGNMLHRNPRRGISCDDKSNRLGFEKWIGLITEEEEEVEEEEEFDEGIGGFLSDQFSIGSNDIVSVFGCRFASRRFFRSIAFHTVLFADWRSRLT